jgi:hypothetical protein
MFAHRFREHLQTPAAPFAGVGLMCAFVPCPMLSTFSDAQQAQIREVYRLAAERAQDQLRRSWSQRPQFSLN